MFFILFIFFEIAFSDGGNPTDLIPLEHNIFTAEYCRDRQRVSMKDRSQELEDVIKLSSKCATDASNGKNETITDTQLSHYQRHMLSLNGFNVKKEGHKFIIKWRI